ncbi:MAG: hypothetical protein HOV86_15535, partial [Thermoactinospora sp.]|nr:hypothetical protein [Thermoactinospora sp.]
DEGPTLDELIAYRERLRELTGADLTRPSWHPGPSKLPIDVEQVPHLTGERIDLPRGDTWHLPLML